MLLASIKDRFEYVALRRLQNLLRVEVLLTQSKCCRRHGPPWSGFRRQRWFDSTNC